MGNPPRDEDADVIVIGFGAAGCAAAIEAHDHGASVVVLEKATEVNAGGNTRVSGNVWFENGDPQEALQYLRALCGDHRVPEPVMRVWSAETARLTQWITDLGGTVMKLGYHLEPEFPELPGSACYGGYLVVEPGFGMGSLWSILRQAVIARGIRVRYQCRARDLITDGNGQVVGVGAEQSGRELRLRARKGVILACGGFENSPEMVRDYLGLTGTGPWGTPENTGDGIRMAQAIGADLWHMSNFYGFMGLMPAGPVTGIATEFRYSDGYIHVDANGRRFHNEKADSGHGKEKRFGRYQLFPKDEMYFVFDSATRLAGPVGARTADNPCGWNRVVEGFDWTSGTEAEIYDRWIACGDSPASSPAWLRIDPAGLEVTIRAYNEACRSGSDAYFGRSPTSLVPLERPPYYGFRCGPIFVYTCGGPRRDEHAHVLDTRGLPIPGLYCAGEISSTYSWAMDGGMMIADALSFGRVAGRTVATRLA